MGYFLNNIFYVYAHYDEKGDIRYIGKGCKNRAYSKEGRSKLWKEVFPNGPYKIEFIAKNLEEEEAFELEFENIKNAHDSGKNIINLEYRNGGGATWIFSEETRRRFSEMRSGKNHPRYGIPVSKEQIEKSEATKRANNSHAKYWSGKKRDPELMKRLVELSHTTEAIEKRRQKMIGRNISEEHKQKVSEASKAHWQVVDRKEMGAKISAAKKGRPNGRLGCTFTDEHKRKISEATKGRIYGKEITDKIRATKLARGNTTKKARAVLCVENGVQYRCAKDAALALNLSDKHIQACCVGRRNKHGGFTFKYAESIQIQSS